MPANTSGVPRARFRSIAVIRGCPLGRGAPTVKFAAPIDTFSIMDSLQVLAPYLRAERARFNAQFGVAQARFPNLNADDFHIVLRDLVAPIVAACHEIVPERSAEVTVASYESALQLCGAQALGPRARGDVLNRAWHELLPRIAPLIVQNPRRCLRRTSNALHLLAQHDADKAQSWSEIMLSLAPHCHDVQTWENAGFVAAWRCGLAHFRHQALEIAKQLSPEIGRLALKSNEENWPQTLQNLQNVWFDSTNENALQWRGQVGDFIGLGGAMSAPPRAFWFANLFWIWNGQSWLNLWADTFGVTLTPAIAPQDLRDESNNSWRVDDAGQVLAGDVRAQFAILARPTSWANDGQTMIVTTQLSHRVYLLSKAT